MYKRGAHMCIRPALHSSTIQQICLKPLKNSCLVTRSGIFELLKQVHYWSHIAPLQSDNSTIHWWRKKVAQQFAYPIQWKKKQLS